MAARIGGVTGFGKEEAEVNLAHNRHSGNERQVCFHYCPLNVFFPSQGQYYYLSVAICLLFIVTINMYEAGPVRYLK